MKESSVCWRVGGATPKPRFDEAVRFAFLPLFFFAASVILEQAVDDNGVCGDATNASHAALDSAKMSTKRNRLDQDAFDKVNFFML